LGILSSRWIGFLTPYVYFTKYILLLQVNIVNNFIFLQVVRTLRYEQLHKTSKLKVYASNEPRIGIVKTAMGACAQIAVFTYAVMRRTPRYEIRLAAFFADNLMNSVAHCGELPINVERPLRHIYELGA